MIHRQGRKEEVQVDLELGEARWLEKSFGKKMPYELGKFGFRERGKGSSERERAMPEQRHRGGCTLVNSSTGHTKFL